MALSNAERQRLHRERLKERLEAVSAASDPEAVKKLQAKLREAKRDVQSIQELLRGVSADRSRLANEALFLRAEVEKLKEGREPHHSESDDEEESEADEVLKRLLVGQYYAAGREMLEGLKGRDPSWLDELTDIAIEEFEATTFTAVSMVTAVQEAGRKAALEAQKRVYSRDERIIRATTYTKPEPAPAAEKKSRRKRAVT